MVRELSREHGRLSHYYRGRRVPPTVLQPLGRTEPDLDLIKQVEQVTTLALEGPAQRFARIRSIGITGGVRDPRIFNLAIIGLADISPQATAKTARSSRGRPICEGGVRQCYRPHPAIPRAGPHGLPSRCSAKFGETDP